MTSALTVEDNDRTDVRIEENERAPRTATVIKTEHGFGFNVRGQVAEGGQLKSIGGQLYAPMQYISAVMKDGPAEKAGLHIGDRIVEVNGQSVEGADHQTVVQMIRQSGKQVKLTVISVSEDEARRLEPESSSSTTAGPGVEYYERRSVPVSVPEFEKLMENGKEYVTYNIHMAGKKTISRRYREFDALNNNLKRQFSDFVFPKLPGKWPFALTDVQLDGRRRGLEDYLDKICSAKVIFESDLVQDFLCLNNEPSRSDPLPNIVPPTSSVLSDTIKIIVQLPDLSVNTFSLSETARTPDLLDVILSDLNVERKWRKYFAIFIQKEGNFIVKLLDSDFPYQIYLQNKDSTPAGGTCLLLRKWLFSVSHEMELLEDEIVCDLLYNEALTNITNGLIDINDEDANLRMLKAQGKKKQYMQLLHKLPSYNTLSFPHCKCDARKTGHIILLLNTTGLSLKACSEEGVLEKQEHSFSWDMISKYEADIEEQTFTFQCLREGKDPRWIRVYSSYYLYIERCADRVKEEKSWKKANASTGFMNNDDDDDDDDDDNL